MIENIYSYALVIFAVTTFIIFREVRKQNKEFVATMLKNPLWPSISFSSIHKVYKIYCDLKGKNIVIFLNLFCLTVALISLGFIIVNAITTY